MRERERERESIKGMFVNIVTLKPLTNINLIQNLLFTIFFFSSMDATIREKGLNLEYLC